MYQSSTKVHRCLVALFYLSTWSLLHAMPLEVDTEAPISRQPTVHTSAAGDKPVIEITAPDETGVSHNVFKEYNVRLLRK